MPGTPDSRPFQFGELARIPGTSTIWAAGSVARTRNSNIGESLIQYNGTLPR